ncbi:MAG: septum formation protein Maf [Eubacterium sp.]|nr:septum formation protein Maf [Eubacterium sp.]
MNQNVVIILASGSPRRKDLLMQAGLEFEVVISDVEESVTKDIPEEVVIELSEQKCRTVTDEFIRKTPKSISDLIDVRKGGILVIGADTVVSMDKAILGKPADSKEAFKMLMNLSGKTHEVYTGVSCKILQYNEYTEGLIETDSFSFYSETKVNMYPFNEYEALDYIATGEPMDKAGAYGIQGIGERLVESISGDYNNVVGFPLSRFMKELSEREYIPTNKSINHIS